GARRVVPARPGRARRQYEAMVARAQERIRAGDIYQVVLSQRFEARLTREPFAVYRALRRINPSPYMYFLRDGATALAGASPEMLVRVEGDSVELHPIAGTRPRGSGAAADAALEAELLSDAKERAEHVMLVDLGRNDLGRVCEPGSVRVPEFQSVQRFSHVMHMVSRVTGRLAAGRDAFDVLRAVFPAGTVSGAPKVSAMRIIGELEKAPRGPYAGAVAYVDHSGNLDSCIVIRTMVARGRRAVVQAGGGIVADSDPAREHAECASKARAVLAAIEGAAAWVP
ncbi:MAG TPA: anthranilate synthase component I family protein, partial [Candidatus Polarisedimenticolia bacterium]|nr:anthranilate synthase component I family protein [Candidatus Polarisedimenticolia bacterium]